MKALLAAGKQLLKDVAGWSIPSKAAAAAGVIVPILDATGAVHLSVGVVAGWLVLAGGAVGVLERVPDAKAQLAAKAAAKQK